MFHDPEEIVLPWRTQVPFILKSTSLETIWNWTGGLVGLVVVVFGLQLFKQDSFVHPQTLHGERAAVSPGSPPVPLWEMLL